MRITREAAVESAKKNLAKRNELAAKATAKVASAVERLVMAEKALEAKIANAKVEAAEEPAMNA